MKDLENSNGAAMNQSGAHSGQDSLIGKYLTFWTDKQLFAIPVADVMQIIQMQPITQIPEFPGYAKGIINLRGNVIPVIDIRLRFGKTETSYDDHTCIIIADISGKDIGVIVEGVEEVTTIGKKEISAPPQRPKDAADAFLTGIGKHEKQVILLLDIQKLLSDDIVSQIAAE